MFEDGEGAIPGSPGRQATQSLAAATAVEAKADSLARQLEDADEQMSAMATTIKQQVSSCSVDCRLIYGS